MADQKLIAPGSPEYLAIVFEINRQLLHPIGSALAFSRDQRTGEVGGFVGLWDCRTTAGGIVFDDQVISSSEAKRRAESFARMQVQHRQARLDKLGFVVQPIGNGENT